MRGLFAFVFALFKWFLHSDFTICPDSEFVWKIIWTLHRPRQTARAVSMLHNLFIYPRCYPQFCTLLFSGGGVSLRVRDGGLGSVQRLHWPQLWRALPPRGCACALWSLCWRARGPRGQSPGLHHLRARGGQDGAQDSQAAPRQGQPHVPDLAVLLLDGHGNYRMELIIIGQLSHYYYYWGNTAFIDFWCARADRIFDYYSIANNERVLLWCAGGA